MIKKMLLTLLLTLFIGVVWGAKPSAKTIVATPLPIVDSSEIAFDVRTFSSFMKFYERGIQEKLYVQVDKPYYCAGDTLWLKGYLVNAITHVPESMTRYIYVELVARRDSLISRIKIMRDEYGFHNCIKLSPSLPEGDYVLRGYTNWMQNWSDDLFFRREIRVVNPLDNSVMPSVSYRLLGENRVEAVVQLHNSMHEPLKNLRVGYDLKLDSKVKSHSAKTDTMGRISVNFERPRDDKAVNALDIYINEQEHVFDRKYVMPSFSNDFDIQFFPEGGDMIPAGLQAIGFKAVATTGLGVDVKGLVYDCDSVLITEFESSHKGMGRFNIMPRSNAGFYAVVTSSTGVTKRVELPKVVQSGCAVQVIPFRGAMLYKVNLTPDISPDSLGLIVMCRGRVMIAEELSQKNLSRVVKTDGFVSGVVQFAVVHKRTGDMLSQRLFFVQRNDYASAQISTDRDSYLSRKPVEVTLRVVNSRGVPAVGSFSVAVTDSNVVVEDSTADNIFTSLLLCSDLRGYIEEPGLYLRSSSIEARDNLNTLMLTQGWCRFDLPAILKRDTKPCIQPKEMAQSISGEIKGFFGQAAKRPHILILQPKIGQFDMFQLEGTNKFTIADLAFADSTVFVLQAMSKGQGIRAMELNVKPESFPRCKIFMPKKSISQIDNALPDAFVRQSKERYYYEGGMRVIDMQSVVVTTQRAQLKNKMYNVSPSRSISGDELKVYDGQNISFALQTLPGVVVNGEQISVRNSSEPPLIYLDNMPVDEQMLLSINISDVEYIDLVSGPGAAIFGTNSSSGVILVGTKTGEGNYNSTPLPSIAKVMQLGYKKPVAFYQPRYDVADSVRQIRRPDLRTTIAWEPRIRTDSTGVAKMRFFSADNASTYNVVLEGITDDGEVCRALGSVQISR